MTASRFLLDAVVAAIRRALEHEKAGVTSLRQALGLAE